MARVILQKSASDSRVFRDERDGRALTRAIALSGLYGCNYTYDMESNEYTVHAEEWYKDHPMVSLTLRELRKEH